MRQAIVILLAGIILGGCSKKSEENNPINPSTSTPVTSISGSITMADSVKSYPVIVAFYSDQTIFVFKNDTVTGTNGAVGDYVDTMRLVGGSAGRNFQLDFPSDRNSVKWLVAWIDRNDNGQPDFATEPVRLARKSISGSSAVVYLWTWGVNGNPDDYTIAYYVGPAVINDFPTGIGATDFMFAF